MGCYVDRNEDGSVNKVGLENTSISEEVSLAIQRNGGNSMNLTSDGKPSKLYEDILALPEVDGDRSKADVIKAKVYSDNFLNWFGDWLQGGKVTSDRGTEFRFLRTQSKWSAHVPVIAY